MRTITVNNFGAGIADDIYGGAAGEFSISKHFDILSYPNRLYPLRGMSADTTGTGIGNVLVGSDGAFYGLGWDIANDPGGPSAGIWKRGASSWTQFTHSPAQDVIYPLFVEYHTSGGVRSLIHASGGNKIVITALDDSAIATHSLTFTNIAQGVVHPKNDILYIPYDNKIAVNNNGSWTDIGFTAPANYRITSVAPYENSLAIACTPSVNGVDYGGSGNNSIVLLWDMNTSNTLADETINWNGSLKVINNLGRVLIGISDVGGATSNILDQDSIQIQAYAGGEPEPILEIPTIKQTTTTPDASINPRVNFINRKRMYFSINIESGSTSPTYRGLWSIGKSKRTGRYVVTLERIATTDNSETGVLAAAIAGDKCSMVHTTEGTLTFTNTTASTGDQWTATSVHETCVNPQMPFNPHRGVLDPIKQKQLVAFAVHYLPLPSSGQVVAKYRVDGGAWTTIFTETTDGAVVTEMTVDASGSQFTSGRNYEFRLESTGFAQILGYSYKYELHDTLI
jgi:hypothetical protein